MRNRRPLAVGVLCCLISTLQAQPISDGLQAQISLETPPPCKSNEYLNTVWNDCWPCAESCNTCTMSFILGLNIKNIEYCTECKEDWKLAWWWDFWPFAGHYYCVPQCTAPAVWDSTVQDCQTLTLVPSTTTLYQCQSLEITSQLTYLNTDVSDPVWTSKLESLYPGSYIGSPSADGSSQILTTEYYRELSLQKTTTNVFDLTLKFSNGKSIKASTSITFVPQILLKDIVDFTTSRRVYASKPFQLNLNTIDYCGGQQPIQVGPKNFTCTLYGVGYENGLKLPGPCYIEAKATKLYADSDYYFKMQYLPKSGSPWMISEWHFRTYNQVDDPVSCDWVNDQIEVFNTASPLTIPAPWFKGPRLDAYYESSFSKTKTPYDVSSGAPLSIQIPEFKKFLAYDTKYFVRVSINSPRAAYSDYYYECEADIIFKKQ